MRISDWSSYMCSSDLIQTTGTAAADKTELPAAVVERLEIIRLLKTEDFAALEGLLAKVAETAASNPSLDRLSVQQLSAFENADRQSVVEGKRVSVSVGRGGDGVM